MSDRDHEVAMSVSPLVGELLRVVSLANGSGLTLVQKDIR